jgi:hypothetical protein
MTSKNYFFISCLSNNFGNRNFKCKAEAFWLYILSQIHGLTFSWYNSNSIISNKPSSLTQVTPQKHFDLLFPKTKVFNVVENFIFYRTKNYQSMTKSLPAKSPTDNIPSNKNSKLLNYSTHISAYHFLHKILLIRTNILTQYVCIIKKWKYCLNAWVRINKNIIEKLLSMWLTNPNVVTLYHWIHLFELTNLGFLSPGYLPSRIYCRWEILSVGFYHYTPKTQIFFRTRMFYLLNFAQDLQQNFDLGVSSKCTQHPFHLRN